jgi:transposase-like protein
MGTSEHESYCPRCDKTTTWENVVTEGRGRRFGCKVCGIQETDLMTDEEAERLRGRNG